MLTCLYINVVCVVNCLATLFVVIVVVLFMLLCMQCCELQIHVCVVYYHRKNPLFVPALGDATSESV